MRAMPSPDVRPSEKRICVLEIPVHASKPIDARFEYRAENAVGNPAPTSKVDFGSKVQSRKMTWFPGLNWKSARGSPLAGQNLQLSNLPRKWFCAPLHSRTR